MSPVLLGINLSVYVSLVILVPPAKSLLVQMPLVKMDRPVKSMDLRLNARTVPLDFPEENVKSLLAQMPRVKMVQAVKSMDQLSNVRTVLPGFLALNAM